MVTLFRLSLTATSSLVATFAASADLIASSSNFIARAKSFSANSSRFLPSSVSWLLILSLRLPSSANVTLSFLADSSKPSKLPVSVRYNSPALLVSAAFNSPPLSASLLYSPYNWSRLPETLLTLTILLSSANFLTRSS